MLSIVAHIILLSHLYVTANKALTITLSNSRRLPSAYLVYYIRWTFNLSEAVTHAVPKTMDNTSFLYMRPHPFIKRITGTMALCPLESNIVKRKLT